jgi:hypothetical protein
MTTVPDVAWSPDGDELLLADGERWRFVSARSGRVRAAGALVGEAPAWYCPTAGGPDAGGAAQ